MSEYKIDWRYINDPDAPDIDLSIDNLTSSLAEKMSQADITNLYIDITKPQAQTGITPAKTDGITDISGTLQACVNYISANGGGYIYIPFQVNGFTISNRINWKSNVSLISNGSMITIPSNVAATQVFYLVDCVNVQFIGKLRMQSTNNQTRVIGRSGQGSNIYGVYIGGNSQEIYIDYVYGQNLEAVVNMQGNGASTSKNCIIKEIAFQDTYQAFFINQYANVRVQYIRGVIQNILLDPLDHVVYINDACIDLVFDTIQASNLNADNGSWAVQLNPHTVTESSRSKRITFNTIHLDGSFSGFVAVLTEGVWIGELTANLNGPNSIVLGAYQGSKYEIGNITVEGSYLTFLTCTGNSSFLNEVTIHGGKVNASGNGTGGYMVRGEYINRLTINNVEFNNITFGGTAFYFLTNISNITFFHCRFNFQVAFAGIPFNIGSGNVDFKECKFINNSTLYGQIITCLTGANANVYRCIMSNFSKFFYGSMTGTAHIFDSTLLDDNSIVNGTFNNEIKRFYGSGVPSVIAPVGSVYFRTDGGASTTYYVKESGTGNTGWIAK